MKSLILLFSLIFSFNYSFAVSEHDLSPLAQKVYQRIQKQDNLRTSVEKKHLLTEGIVTNITFNGKDIFDEVYRLVSQAKKEVLISSFMFHVYKEGYDKRSGDDIPEEMTVEATKRLGEALIAAQKKLPKDETLKVIILINQAVHDILLNGRDRVKEVIRGIGFWQKMGLDLNKIKIKVGGRHHLATGSLHDKSVIVDEKIAIITGANFTSDYDYKNRDYTWHDVAFTYEGPVIHKIKEAFIKNWQLAYRAYKVRASSKKDKNKSSLVFSRKIEWLQNVLSKKENNFVPMIMVPQLGTDVSFLRNRPVNSPQSLAWEEALKKAQNHIEVMSPNIGCEHFLDLVVEAVKRGVHVRIIATKEFNSWVYDTWKGKVTPVGISNDDAFEKLKKGLKGKSHKGSLELRWYSWDGIKATAGNGAHVSHLKYFSADDELTIQGSGNHDELSWYYITEINILISGKEESQRFREIVFEKDFEKAETALSL